jgi:uncharacterized surface protein with fasciclin (FAS1) repeats
MILGNIIWNNKNIKHINMKRISILIMVFATMSLSVLAQKSKNIVEVAAGSSDFTTLVTALKAADLVGALEADGPFTVFAPTNEAFAKLPAGTVETLLKPENKAKLSSILTYHVVSGNIDAAAVVDAIKQGKGKAVLTTLSGAKLTAAIVKGKVVLTDENGGQVTVTTTDLKATNGVIHVIDGVLLP